MEKVVDVTNVLLSAMNEFLAANPTSSLDVFMGVHTFHKFVVKDIAIKSMPDTPFVNTVHMADITFRKAMRELRDQAAS